MRVLSLSAEASLAIPIFILLGMGRWIHIGIGIMIDWFMNQATGSEMDQTMVPLRRRHVVSMSCSCMSSISIVLGTRCSTAAANLHAQETVVAVCCVRDVY